MEGKGWQPKHKQPVTLHLQGGNREINAGAQLAFSLSCCPGAYGMVSLTFIDSPSSVSHWKDSPKHVVS